MPHTLVSFHAHPDDEVLLTGGTLAKAAQDGHRVVLVVATSGEAGLAATDLAQGDLGSVRESELHRSAEALGCARVVLLGYADSGIHGERPGPDTFTRTDPAAAAERLAQILQEEHAGVLTIYDPAGGYGHPDHRQVHIVGTLAAAMSGTPVVLEATLDRTLITWLARLVRLIPGGLGGVRYEDLVTSYTARAGITHRVDVRAQSPAKRRAMQAHASQATGGGPRTLSMLLRLPDPLFRRLLGREWFVQHGRAAGGEVSGDIFDGLGSSPR